MFKIKLIKKIIIIMVLISLSFGYVVANNSLTVNAYTGTDNFNFVNGEVIEYNGSLTSNIINISYDNTQPVLELSTSDGIETYENVFIYANYKDINNIDYVITLSFNMLNITNDIYNLYLSNVVVEKEYENIETNFVYDKNEGIYKYSNIFLSAENLNEILQNIDPITTSTFLKDSITNDLFLYDNPIIFEQFIPTNALIDLNTAISITFTNYGVFSLILSTETGDIDTLNEFAFVDTIKSMLDANNEYVNVFDYFGLQTITQLDLDIEKTKEYINVVVNTGIIIGLITIATYVALALVVVAIIDPSIVIKILEVFSDFTKNIVDYVVDIFITPVMEGVGSNITWIILGGLALYLIYMYVLNDKTALKQKK